MGSTLIELSLSSDKTFSGTFSRKIFLIDIFGEDPNVCDLKGIVYDRACELHPFTSRLANEGNFAASKYQKLHFIVDIFHVEKHTLSKCILESKDCLYHPHLKKFDFVRKMNTEVAEQSFSRLNPFKYSTRKMSYCKRLLFLKFVDHSANLQLMRKSKH